MAIGGFVLALVGLLLAGIVMGGTYVAMGTKAIAYVWVVLCMTVYRVYYFQGPAIRWELGCAHLGSFPAWLQLLDVQLVNETKMEVLCSIGVWIRQ